MIDVETAKRIHSLLIDQFGGSKGVRDLGGLESALSRPYSTFDGNDLYTTTIEKAAALFESLIIAHPFIDGNKRISYVLLRMILLQDGQDIYASQDEKFEFVISASKGFIRYDTIKEWLLKHVRKKHEKG